MNIVWTEDARASGLEEGRAPKLFVLSVPISHTCMLKGRGLLEPGVLMVVASEDEGGVDVAET